MRLQDLASKELILAEIGSRLRTESLRRIVSFLGQRRGYDRIQVEEILAHFLRQHQILPSGLPGGVAFISARVRLIDKPILVIGLSEHGIDFQAPDNEPSHVVLLYLGGVNSRCVHDECIYPSDEEKRMLGRLMSALASNGIVERFLQSKTCEEVWQVILAIDAEFIDRHTRRKEVPSHGL